MEGMTRELACESGVPAARDLENGSCNAGLCSSPDGQGGYDCCASMDWFEPKTCFSYGGTSYQPVALGKCWEETDDPGARSRALPRPALESPPSLPRRPLSFPRRPPPPPPRAGQYTCCQASEHDGMKVSCAGRISPPPLPPPPPGHEHHFDDAVCATSQCAEAFGAGAPACNRLPAADATPAVASRSHRPGP